MLRTGVIWKSGVVVLVLVITNRSGWLLELLTELIKVFIPPYPLFIHSTHCTSVSLLCATCTTCATCAERMLEIQSEVLAMGHMGRHLSREKPERVLYVNLTIILRQQFSAREYRIMCFRIFEKKWIERNTTTLSYFSIWVGLGHLIRVANFKLLCIF